MRIVAMLLRIIIILIGVKLMFISGFNINSAPFCSGIGFIVIGLYLVFQAIVGPKALLCPLFHGCKTGECKNSK